MFGTIWNAIKTYARKQNEFSLKGIDVSLVDIHEHDHNWSMLPFLDVLSNTVSGPSERVIIMKVKQGHSESRLVAPINEDLPIFKMTWSRLSELVIEYIGEQDLKRQGLNSDDLFE